MYEEIFATSQARVLRFLAYHSNQSFYEQEIVGHTGVSRSAVNLATRSLHQAGLLLRERRGRMNFYTADEHHPFVRQFKILSTIAQLEPLLRGLRPLARQVILFVSCKQGTDTAESELGLFILASDRGQIMAAVSHYHSERRAQSVVIDNQELAAMKEREPAFYAEVQRGIVLWRGDDELAD